MGERKVLNRYFPPDFDPAALPKRKRPQTNDMKVRMMLPMSVRCKTCGTFMYKGTKFNTRKEDVLGENYLGIQIYRFYYRCTTCSAEFTMKTDPKTSDYVLEEGATRNYEHWREAEKEKAEAVAQREEEEMGNAMKALENRTLESKREMDIMAALDEMRALKSKHAKVTTEEALAALQREADKHAAAEDGDGAGAAADVGDLAEFYRLRRAAHTSRLQDSSEDDDDGGGRGAGPSGVNGAGGASRRGRPGGAGRTAGAGLSLAAAAMEDDEEEGGGGEEEQEARQRVGDGVGMEAAGAGGQRGNVAGASGPGRPQGADHGSGDGGNGEGTVDPLDAALAGVRKEQNGSKPGVAGGAAGRAGVGRPQVKVVAKPRGAGNGQPAAPGGLGLGYGGDDSDKEQEKGSSKDGEGNGRAGSEDGGEAGLTGLLGGYGSSGSSPERE